LARGPAPLVVAAQGKVLGVVNPAPRRRERRLLDRSSSVILLARRLLVAGFGAAPPYRARLTMACRADVQLLEDGEARRPPGRAARQD